MNYQFSKKRHQRVGGLPTCPRGGMVEDVDGQRTFNHLRPTFSLLGSLLSVVSGSPHLLSQHTGCGIRRIRCSRLAWPDLSQQNKRKQQQRFASETFQKIKEIILIGRFWLSQILDKCEFLFFFFFPHFPKKEITSCLLKHMSFFYS